MQVTLLHELTPMARKDNRTEVWSSGISEASGLFALEVSTVSR